MLFLSWHNAGQQFLGRIRVMMDGRALIAKPARSMHDWLKATEDERKALYTATKRVVDGHFRGDWRKCIAEAFAGEHVGDSFEDNFRKGKISRKDASAIGRWLAGAQPEEFQRLEAALAQRAGHGWTDFLKSYQKTDALRVVRATNLGLVGLAGRAKAATQRVELGEEFFLQLTTAINGAVIGLQRSGGSWFYLPLDDATGSPIVPTGTSVLPRSSNDGAPVPLCEDADRGTVLFAVLVIPGDAGPNDGLAFGDAVPGHRLDALAAFLVRAGAPFEVHTLAINIH